MSEAVHSSGTTAEWVGLVLRRHFPPVCGVACQTWHPSLPVLPAVETMAVAHAADVRKQEFAIGRIAARAALRSIGIPAVPIPVLPGRAPGWPRGIVGSIAHDKEIAVAVVARREQVLSLGVDLEKSAALTENLWPEVLTAAEKDFLDTMPESQRGRLATVFFAVKEAFYKFQYPLTEQWLDFKEVEVQLNIAGETAVIRTSRPLPIGGKQEVSFNASFTVGDEFTLAAVSLLASN